MQSETLHDEFDDIVKVIVIGDTSTGKTNIIYTYSKEIVPKTVMPTIGVEYTSKMVMLEDGVVLKAQIWDTAGQEQYRAVTMSHYRKATGAMIVYDVTKKQSFNHVYEWLSAVRERADANVQIILIGHKIDELKREVPREEGESLAAREHILYSETSIRDPSTIQEAFNKMLSSTYVIREMWEG